MPTNPLKDLERQREKEGDNPFLFKRAVQQQRPLSPHIEDIENPFLYRRDTLTQTPEVMTPGGRFAAGTIKGAMRPVRAFYEPFEDVELGTAGAVGEFVGMGASFIPLYTGARAALTGVGMLKTANILGRQVRYIEPLGRTAGSVRGAQAAAGALSFGAFEAFAGDEPAEALYRFPRGLAEGVAFEAAAMRVTSAWRARQTAKRRAGWKPEQVTGDPLPAHQVDAPVHPFALKLEMAISPSLKDTPEVAAAKLRAIGDPTTQLDDVLLRVLDDYTVGGMAVLPGMSRKEITQLYKRLDEMGRVSGALRPTWRSRIRGQTPRKDTDFYLASFSSIKGEDLHRVLLVDRRREFYRLDPSRRPKSLGDFLKDIRTEFVERLSIEFPKVLPGKKGDYWGVGEWSPAGLRHGEIRVVQGMDEIQTLRTLVHEVAHHITQTGLDRRGFKKRLTGDMEGWTRPVLRELFDVDVVSPETLAAMRTELAEVRRITNIESIRASSPGKKTLKELVDLEKAWYAKEKAYFDSDIELIPRFFELFLYDPIQARDIAPVSFVHLRRLFQDEAPRIYNLLDKERKVFVDRMHDYWRQLDSGPPTVWQRGRPHFSSADLAEFQKTGWAPGLRAQFGGKDLEFVARVGKEDALIRSLDTGEELITAMKGLQQPVLQSNVKRVEEVVRAVDQLLDEKIRHVPVNLSERVWDGGAGVTAVRRAVVDTDDYLHINTSVRAWLKSLPDDQLTQLNNRLGTLNPIELDELKRIGPMTAFDQQQQLNNVLEILGYKGILQNDNGIVRLFVRDRNTVRIGDVMESQRFGAHVSGSLNDAVLFPSIDDAIKGALRAKGVSEGDMEYFMRIAMQRAGKRMNDSMDPDVRQVVENVNIGMAKLEGAAPAKAGTASKMHPLEEAQHLRNQNDIARAGLEMDYLHDGRVSLRDTDTKTLLGRFADEDMAADFAREMGVNDGLPPLGSFPGAASHGGGAGPPPFQSQVIQPGPAPGEAPQSWIRRIVDAHTLFASAWTAIENFAKVAERKGFGQAYTEVYLKGNRAMLEVHRELSQVGRDALGGQTFKHALEQITRATGKVSKKRYPIVSGHVEAASKEEVARAGGLMTRAMTPNEIRVAKHIERVGLQDDVPRLMSLDRLMDSALKGNLEHTIARMKQIELSPEAQDLLRIFESMPKFKTQQEVAQYLGLTQDEQQVLKIIRDSMTADKDKFSIYAVSRYAAAPQLKKGFKDGRQQFAFENKMTPEELKVSELVSWTLDAGFRDSGIETFRYIQGYWPHLRKWAQAGFVPGKGKFVPDELGFTASRFRSGELSVYDLDPISATYRHLRSLYMKRHFDPVLPEITNALEGIKTLDARVYRLMDEYIQELLGSPHASFEKLQGAMERSMAALGVKVPERLATDLVSAGAALSSAAMIPFRPSLIARNFYESLLKVSPRTGIPDYFDALRYVVSPETRKAAFDEARKALAIRPSTARLQAGLAHAEEVFGPTAPLMKGFHQKYMNIFNKGFEWYQSADDFGRAIAYHAHKRRVQKHLGDFATGKTSWDDFIVRTKIDMFDPLDVKIVEKMFRAGEYQQAHDHLGRVLARETMTRYGYADHPAGWNSVLGRLFGQFGTWPVQYKDYVLQGLTRGSTKNRAEFAAIHGAITGGTVLGGASIGLNLQNWTGMMFYTGGPWADLTIDGVRSITGSQQERALARRSLYGNVPVLGWMETGSPRSMFIPGSFLLGDLNDMRTALQDGNVFEGVMRGTGVRLIRPEERQGLEWLYRF